MNETPEDSFSNEIEDRLEHLFGEEEPSQTADNGSGDAKDYPLRDLKSIVLSIDWEINEEVMTGFVDQVGVLQDRYRDDKIVLVFLQLLGSIGDYIRKNLGQSHPDAFRILNSLFGGLEKIVQGDDLAENEKKRILSIELGKYKELKGELARTKTPAPQRKSVVETPPESPSVAGQPDVVQAIEDLKQFFRDELTALKAEIQALREELARRGNSPEDLAEKH